MKKLKEMFSTIWSWVILAAALVVLVVAGMWYWGNGVLGVSGHDNVQPVIIEEVQETDG